MRINTYSIKSITASSSKYKNNIPTHPTSDFASARSARGEIYGFGFFFAQTARPHSGFCTRLEAPISARRSQARVISLEQNAGAKPL